MSGIHRDQGVLFVDEIMAVSTVSQVEARIGRVARDTFVAYLAQTGERSQ
jgi:hypothetical protein